MSISDFRDACLKILGSHRRADCAEWSVSYLLATLRHHGPEGEALRQRAVSAGF